MSQIPPNSVATKIVSEFEEWMTNDFFPTREEALEDWAKASKHKINPYLVAYRAQAMAGEVTAESIAESLITVSWLGTSTNTSFGTRLQTQFTKMLKDVYGSAVPGIDIEFTDCVDQRKKYAQIKLGPETINADDVTTIDDKFKAIKRLATTNALPLQLSDLVVGVIYGSQSQLNGNYRQLQAKNYQVYVANEFWVRLTGVANLEEQLVEATIRAAKKTNSHTALKKAIQDLAKDPVIKALE